TNESKRYKKKVGTKVPRTAFLPAIPPVSEPSCAERRTPTSHFGLGESRRPRFGGGPLTPIRNLAGYDSQGPGEPSRPRARPPHPRWRFAFARWRACRSYAARKIKAASQREDAHCSSCGSDGAGRSSHHSGLRDNN